MKLLITPIITAAICSVPGLYAYFFIPGAANPDRLALMIGAFAIPTAGIFVVSMVAKRAGWSQKPEVVLLTGFIATVLSMPLTCLVAYAVHATSDQYHTVLLALACACMAATVAYAMVWSEFMD